MDPFEQDVAYAIQNACIKISDHLTSNNINWEQRRYEIARDLFVNTSNMAPEEAVRQANQLIQQLKQEAK